MRRIARLIVVGVVALALGAGSASPAGAFQLYQINAPYKNTAYTLEALAYTHHAPYSCNDPRYSPCFNTFLELQAFHDNRWLTLGRTDAPNTPPPPSTPYVIGWSARGTCMSTPEQPWRDYRSYYEQKRHDQGSVYFVERVWLINHEECRV